MILYELYRNLHIEWVILLVILAMGLYACFSSEGVGIGKGLYVILNALTMMIIMPLLNKIPFVRLFETQNSPIWTFYVAMIASCLIWICVFFRNDLKEAVIYIVFYHAFILSFKTAMGAFYAMEPKMDPHIYAVIDISTIVILQFLAILLMYLFVKVRFSMENGIFTGAYKVGVLIPVGVLIVLVLSASGFSYVWENTAEILSIVIVVLLPMYYYVMSLAMSGVKEKYDLESALFETKAQLSRYRYSLELEDRIRKERHELKNNYLYIQALVQEDRIDELKQYLDRITGERMDAISSIYTGNVLMDYILNRKIADAKKHHIPVVTDVMLGKDAKVNEEAFCTVLLNLMDNAIEASVKESSPRIAVSVREVGGYMVLCVKNRISYDVLKENPELHTTKPDGRGHGHGIMIIKKACEENNGMLDIKMEDDCFMVTAGLPIL